MVTERTVLVTGAARRIGAAIARHLHGRGCRVAVHYRSSGEAARALQAELEAIRADSTLLVEADLQDPQAPERMIREVTGHFGRLDVLVNNASAYYSTALAQATLAQWQELFASNVRAPYFLCQQAAPWLRQAAALPGGGCIINMADIYAERPLPGYSLYSMAKAALVMMTQALARELGPQVRVNAVAPGNILWSDNPVKAETLAVVRERTALARQGEPADIVSAVDWLVFGGGYVTGQVLAVDGGRNTFI
ncbi:MAG: pteridine reductase [Xanthomonadales bacterium]|nr:pteridine reductase [Xanthomonadales bacterium]